MVYPPGYDPAGMQAPPPTGPAAHSSGDAPGSAPTVPYVPISPNDPWVGFMRKMFPNASEGDILQYAGAFKNNMNQMFQTTIKQMNDYHEAQVQIRKELNPEEAGS